MSLLGDCDMRVVPYLVGAYVAGVVFGWFARELNDYLARKQ